MSGSRTGYQHALVFAAACAGMTLFGISLTTLGSVLPPLIDRYGFNRAEAGSLLSLMSLGILAGSLVFGPIVDRFGYRSVLVTGALGVLAGLEEIGLARSQWLLRGTVVVFGIGGGFLNGATNALVSDISSQSRGAGLSLLGVFFGAGAFGMPLVLGLLLDRMSYAAVLEGLGLLVFIPLGFFVAIRFPPPKQPQGFPIGQAGRLLSETTLLLLGAMLFLQSGLEITISGWSAEYAHTVLGLPESRSALVLSLFWLGMISARLVLTALLRRLSPARVLLAFLAICCAGSVLFLAFGSLATAAVGLFLVGFGLASGFPILLGYIGELYAELTGSAFSIALVMALAGGSVLPYVTGRIGNHYGLRAALQAVPAGALAMAALFAVVLRRLAAHRASVSSKERTAI